MQLAAAAAQGNQEAFEHLILRYRSYIYTIAWKIALNEEDALDITQNVFLRLAEKINTFNGNGSFRSWVGAIAAREAISFLRRPERREIATAPENLLSLANAANNRPGQTALHESLNTQQQRQLVHDAVAQLPPQQRAIFALRFMDDMQPGRIAEQLGLPPRQVRSQLHNAIDRLRQILTKGANHPS